MMRNVTKFAIIPLQLQDLSLVIFYQYLRVQTRQLVFLIDSLASSALFKRDQLAYEARRVFQILKMAQAITQHYPWKYSS